MDTIDEDTPIGWALTPGNTVDSFDFITDRTEGLKSGEFIYYEKDELDSDIVCRIKMREDFSLPVENLPQEFKSRASDKVIEAVENNDAHKFSVQILGIYDENVENFQNLRMPPAMGQEVYLTSNDFLSHVLNPPKEGEGGLQIATLLNRPEVDLHVDLNEVATKHLGVLASTGAGKSYTVGVLLEEMVKPGNRGTSVVFDIHGEYYTLAEPHEYSDRFNHIPMPKIKIANLDVEDFDVAFPEGMTNVQRERLREVLNSLDLSDGGEFGFKPIREDRRDQVRIDYSLDDMIGKLSESSDIDNAIAWQLNTLKDFQSLNVEEETKIEDMCEPGKCNIIEFPPGASKSELNLIVWHLTKRIFEARRNSTRAQREDLTQTKNVKNEKQIDVPVMLVIEEAHNFAPNYREVPTRRLLQEVAREGRKFGVGLCIISQRASRLDEDVLSQCNSTIIMKVKNEVDQNAIARTVEAAGEDLIRDLPGLTVGQAVLAGSFINTPVLSKIRKRETEHGGRTPDVVKESVEAFQKLHSGEQKKAEADGQKDEKPSKKREKRRQEKREKKQRRNEREDGKRREKREQKKRKRRRREETKQETEDD